MRETDESGPTRTCEEILRGIKRYNSEHDLCPSENVVIERLLDRRLELIEAYAELHRKLGKRRHALEVFFDALLSSAVIWSPQRIVKARDGRKRLRTVNELIASKAKDLANLLREREDLHNHSGFATNTHYHVCQVIEEAARDNYYFKSWIRDDLEALCGRFDIKYWPWIHEFMEALARDAEGAELEATDRITAAATTGRRASLADFLKAFFAAIDENSIRPDAFIPAELKLTDATLASLANCVLDLGPDELVDSGYVKRFRQRQREEAETRGNQR